MEKEKTQTSVFVACLILTIFSTASDAQNNGDATYYCVGEFGGGLWYEKSIQKWEGSSLKPNELSKFVLKLKPSESVDYEVSITPAGEKFPAQCLNMAGNKSVSRLRGDVLDCRAISYYFRFNLRNNRFLQFYTEGYINGAENNDDTPSVIGGLCTKIE